MSRGIDLSALSPAERLIAAGGAILFLNGFVPWWYRIRTPSHTYLHNAGLTGWGLIAVLMGFIAVISVVVWSTNRSARRADHILYDILAFAALGSLIVQGRQGRVEWIGFWVAMAAALVMLIGGLRRSGEHKRGWA